ncbi:MAG: hypothetical protein QXK89_03215 [Candidatus Bathyarchaeia archaeon]|nr:hypothetical protein [Candidatus Bathyarchaeota archaeon]
MKKMNFETYDDLIKALVREKWGVKDSLFGSNPRLTSFKEEEEAEFHEL